MYWVARSGREPAGPMTAEAVAAGLRSGEIAQDVLVCQVGTTAWKALADVAEVAMAALELEPDTEQVPMDRLTGALGDFADASDDLPTIRPNAPPDDGGTF